MPFAIKDILQHKRNDRQIREIHEKEYLKYLINLRQQQQNFNYSKQFYLSSNYLDEIERSRQRNALTKQNQFKRIQHENYILYERLLKVNKRTMIDNKNNTYQQNLDIFNSKHLQQRFYEYKRIYNDNQILLERINNVRGYLINKQQCDNDWKNHINFMKKTSNYPENIDKFISKMTKNQQKQADFYSNMRNAQWNNRHSIIEPSTQLTITPLAILLDES